MQDPLETKIRWFPHVTVAAVIEKNNQFLLVRENQNPPVLNQPAGHLEENETLLQAVNREVLEETGHQFSPEYLVGIYRWANKEHTYVRFCFAGKIIEQKQQTLDPDILEAVWLDRNNIMRDCVRSPLVMQCINDYCAGKRFELSVLNELN